MKSKELFHSIRRQLEDVEKQLNIRAASIVESWGRNGQQAGHINRVIHHLLDKPGKMLRPALVLLSAGIAGWDPLRADKRLNSSLVLLSTAVELIHSASLIHDDIIDNERTRRGRSALHRRFGNQTAVLTGDILYAHSFSLLSELQLPNWERHLEIHRLYSDTTRSMCLGEIIEQRTIDERRRIGLDNYLHILKNKTAVLMSASCRSGAILAGAASAAVDKLAEFGMAFGLAFQLLDDHRDSDALISEEVDILSEAAGQMSRARAILEEFPESVYRSELIRACDFVTEAVRITAS